MPIILDATRLTTGTRPQIGWSQRRAWNRTVTPWLGAPANPVGAGNSAVVVDLPRCGPILSLCTESRTDSWSQNGARNPWSAPTTELWAPTPPVA